ncbi:hypothetical protein [Rhizobium halophilum]|uniref:hypothetical protein n=1 Tax=Rhizobium halophilum TaxID=2846852 RepID=UPI001EFD998B|nr:hypothetical protein [Rhizobium halophilum]MCF6371337.1 hypothetical protein [Rhizobium halophilum]
MTDREPTVINTGSSDSGGWAVAVILLIVLFGLGLYLFGGGLFGDGSRDVDVDVSLPKVEAPAAPAD